MKHFLRQNGLLLLIIALLLSVLIGIVSAVMGGNADPLSNAVGFITTPIRNGVSAVLDWAEACVPMSFIMRRWSSRSRTWSARSLSWRSRPGRARQVPGL